MPAKRIPGLGRAAGAVAAAFVAGAVAACEALPPGQTAERPPETPSDVTPPADAQRLAGTWRLARVERRDQNGAPLPDFDHRGIGQAAAIGYLMYDGEHVGLVVQREASEPRPEGAPAPDAALAAAARYTAYFGRYAVDEPAGRITHHLAGSLDPSLTGGEAMLSYELTEDRLVLMPPLQCPDSFVTDRGCGYGTTGLQLRNVWERVETTGDSGESVRPLLGFWEIDRIERRTADGAAVPTDQYAGGFLMYMPSGHMAVHLMRADRPPFAGSPPTPAEAEAAVRSYLSYFGPFRVLEDAANVVLHQRIGHLEARRVGSEARRAFTRRGGQLLLEPPPATVGGETVRTTIYWNRLGPPSEPAP